MSEIIAIGIKSFKMGDIAADGGMGTTLNALPDTVRGSALIKTSEPGVTNYFANNKPRPIASLANGDVVEEINAEFYDISPAHLAALLGGTAVDASAGVDGGKYQAHTVIPQVEKSIEIITKNDVKIEAVRVLVVTSIDWNLNDDGISKVKVRMVIMEPTKAETPAYTFTYPE